MKRLENKFKLKLKKFPNITTKERELGVSMRDLVLLHIRK